MKYEGFHNLNYIFTEYREDYLNNTKQERLELRRSRSSFDSKKPSKELISLLRLFARHKKESLQNIGEQTKCSRSSFKSSSSQKSSSSNSMISQSSFLVPKYFKLLKNEPFFANINWDELQKQRMSPPYSFDAIKQSIVGTKLKVLTKHLDKSHRMFSVIEEFWNTKGIKKPLRACDYVGDIFHQLKKTILQNRKAESPYGINNSGEVTKVHKISPLVVFIILYVLVNLRTIK